MMNAEVENKVWEVFWEGRTNLDGIRAVVSVVFEEAARIATAKIEDAPEGNDNGATRDGWEMACKEIAKHLIKRGERVSA